MKLIASLAPARAEIEAGVVAKADQYQLFHWAGINEVVKGYL